MRRGTVKFLIIYTYSYYFISISQSFQYIDILIGNNNDKLHFPLSFNSSLPESYYFFPAFSDINPLSMDKLIMGGDSVDIVHKQKIVGNFKKATLIDPKDYSNRRSKRTVNTQIKPQRP